MDLPIVYIEKEPFLEMILASVETFKRECFGYVFGYKPSNKRNSYIITSVMPIQLIKKRGNGLIEQSKLSARNIVGCIDKYPVLFPVIGDFHSHPEWGSHKRIPRLSDRDIADMVKNGCSLGVVIKISSINKERILWQRGHDGGIKGSLANYKFHLNVCRVVEGAEGFLDECLTVNAPAAIKAMNRALGYF